MPLPGPLEPVEPAGSGGTFDLKSEAQDVIPFADTVTGAGGAKQGFLDLLTKFLNAIMAMGILAMLVYLLWGAIEWITSGGDSSKVNKARDRMLQAVIGVIVLSSTLAVFRLVQHFLGINVINFSNPTETWSDPRNPPWAP